MGIDIPALALQCFVNFRNALLCLVDLSGNTAAAIVLALQFFLNTGDIQIIIFPFSRTVSS